MGLDQENAWCAFSLVYHLVSWCKLQIHGVGGPSDLMCMLHRLSSKKVYTQWQLKFAHIIFLILNSHVTVTYLSFIKNSYFYAVKQKNWKWLYWFFCKQDNCWNKMTSVRKSYCSKYVKKLLPAERYGNILTFDKESKRESVISADSFVKNNLNMNLGLKFLLCLNGKFFNFQKTPFRYYGGFMVAINAFLWNCE